MTEKHIVIDGVSGYWEPDAAPVPEQEPEIKPGYLSPHFRASEFTCNHCNSVEGHAIPQELLDMLEDLRAHFGGKPVTLNSAYRCKTHNDNVGSTDGSWHRYHTSGEGATDIVISGATPTDVYNYLCGKYPDRCGIGRYSSFTHLDNDHDKRRW